MFNKIKKFISNRDEYYPNIEIFSYHFLKALRKSIIKIGIIKPKNNNKDMFDWPLYHLHYIGELKKQIKNYTQSLKPIDYKFENGQLVQKNSNIKPLHPLHKSLYETIIQLNPESIFEMGCGNGMHLYNLQILLPKARVCGVDLLEEQLTDLKKTYPTLSPNVKQADATIPFTTLPFEPCDVCYTQAVIMHIHTGDLHLKALENLFAMSKKYVILRERMKNHDYKNEIQKLFDDGKIKWNNIYFYKKRTTGLNSEDGIICSSIPINNTELIEL